MDVTSWAATAAGLMRARAKQRIEEWPGDPAAAVFEYCAELVEREATRFADAPLAISEAANESGYSAAHLRELAHDGVLELVDGPGPMRIRRGDLPRKPGLGAGVPQLSSASRALGERVIEGRK